MLFAICITSIKYVCVEDNISKTLEVTVKKKTTSYYKQPGCSGKEKTVDLSCSCGLLSYLMEEGLLFSQVISGHFFSYKLSVSFRISWNLQSPSFIWYYYTYFNLWAPKSNITWLISCHGLFQGVRKLGPHRGNNTQHRNGNEENCEGGIDTYPWGYDVAWQRSVTHY